MNVSGTKREFASSATRRGTVSSNAPSFRQGADRQPYQAKMMVARNKVEEDHYVGAWRLLVKEDESCGSRGLGGNFSAVREHVRVFGQ
jgi:hypothetical protein